MRNLSTAFFAVLVSFALLLSSCSAKEQKIAPPAGSVDLVKTELAMLNKHLPIEGGVGMLITEAEYDDATYTIKYKYQYTVPGVKKPSESQINEAKKLALLVLKNQPKEKKLAEQGFTFLYEYYSLEDEYLFTQTFSKEDL